MRHKVLHKTSGGYFQARYLSKTLVMLYEDLMILLCEERKGGRDKSVIYRL